MTLSQTMLTFTTANWGTVQLVTLHGVDDSEVDGPVSVTISIGPATSDDARYNGASGPPFNITNEDNDSATLTVNTPLGTRTSERGTPLPIEISLAARPTETVTLSLSSSDSTEGAIDKNVLTFDTQNWSVPQTIVAMGSDDSIADGPQAWAIRFAPADSMDSLWSGAVMDDILLTTLDDELQQLTLSTRQSSRHPSLSDDGTRVAFSSELELPGDTNGPGSDLFVGDVLTGEYRNVTRDCVPAGSPWDPVISGDGTAVVFSSKCFSGNPNNHGIAVYGVDNGAVEVVVATGISGRLRQSTITADGRVVALVTESSLVPEDTDGLEDIYFYDRLTGQFTLATGSAIPRANASTKTFHVPHQAFGGQDRYFVFETDARGLVPGDTNGIADVYLLDRQVGTMSRVSEDGAFSGGGEAPSLSRDGRFVALGGDFHIGGSSAGIAFYTKDLSTNGVTFIAPRHASDHKVETSISGDGATVAFLTFSRLAAADINNTPDVYTWSRASGAITRMTEGPTGIQAPNAVWTPSGFSLATSAPYIAFSSPLGLLGGDVSDQGNRGLDVFIAHTP